MPTRMPRKFCWQTQVKQIEGFHLGQCLAERQWSIRKTAKMLNRSLASVSEDLRLSLALRIRPEVSEFGTKDAALNYLREKKKCQKYPYNNWTDPDIKQIVENIKAEMEGARDA